MPVLKQQEVFAGRYLLDHYIGEGGFSEVWMSKDLMADEAVVAIKVYAAQQRLDEWGLRQFRNEFTLTHHLFHPHLLKVHHFDIAEGIPYLVMTYCPYGSLGYELRKNGIFSERQLAQVMCQIGSALAEIHSQEPAIIHQDIKPDNILLLQPELYVLADFGISSRIRHTLTRTALSHQALSVAYAPPERFDHRPIVSAASDIFSLGVTLYEMCTNTVPWEGAGGQCLLKGARIPTLPQEYSTDLSDILQACMSVDPGSRPTAADLYQKGIFYLENSHWPSIQPKKNKRYRSAAFIASMATAAVAFAAVAGMSMYNVQQEPAMEQAMAANSVLPRTIPIETATQTADLAEPEKPNGKSDIATTKRQSSSKKADLPKKEKLNPIEPKRALAKKAAPTRQEQKQKPAPAPGNMGTEEWTFEVETKDQTTTPAGMAVADQPIVRQPQKVEPKENLVTSTVSAPILTPSPAETTKTLPAEKTAAAASNNQETINKRAERPATSNTSIQKEKKPLFDFNKKPNADKQWRQYKRQYEKRLKQIRKGN